MDGSVSGVGVLDKAVAVLDTLAESPATLADLVATTGLTRATAHRLAVALERHGFVGRDGAGRFILGPRLITLGRLAGVGLPLAEAAGPALEALRDETGESVQLYVRHGDRRVCIRSLESPHGLRTIVPVGASLPLDRGSAGRVLGDPTSVPPRGWLDTAGEREPGVASVSAPVWGPGGDVVAAVSVSGPIPRITRSPGRRFGRTVAAAARRIEASLT